jgi:endonuclease/exonuclease/phosphatase family metal-dependent hydrolase
MTTLRIASWNVRACLGLGARRSIDRVADVLRSLAVDVALLQELDVGRPRSDGEDQPRAIALRLGVEHVFGAAVLHGEASYGNAILSHTPLEEVDTFVLPCAFGAEPRACTRAVTPTRIGRIELAVTHFGLIAGDRRAQAEHVATMLGAPAVPRVLGGDLNDGPRSSILATLAGEHLVRADSPATFPSFLPVARLDHLLVDRRLTIAGIERPMLWAIRAASDHLPLVLTLTSRDGAS